MCSIRRWCRRGRYPTSGQAVPVTDAAEAAARLARVFEGVRFEPRSATIYGSVAAGTADDDSDIDVLCVVDSMPQGAVLSDLDDAVDYEFDSRVSLSLVLTEEAERDAADGGSVVTWAVERGVLVAGTPLADLFPESAVHDEIAAATRAHERSAQRAQELRSQDLTKVPRHGLYEILTEATNAALLHHGLGRFKTAAGRLDKSAAKLETLVGKAAAASAVDLCRAFENDITRASPEEVTEVSALVTSLLERATDPAAPGARTL